MRNITCFIPARSERREEGGKEGGREGGRERGDIPWRSPPSCRRGAFRWLASPERGKEGGREGGREGEKKRISMIEYG